MLLTIFGHGLAEWRADAHYYACEDVLVGRNEEEGGILGILDIRLIAVEMGWNKPD